MTVQMYICIVQYSKQLNLAVPLACTMVLDHTNSAMQPKIPPTFFFFFPTTYGNDFFAFFFNLHTIAAVRTAVAPRTAYACPSTPPACAQDIGLATYVEGPQMSTQTVYALYSTIVHNYLSKCRMNLPPASIASHKLYNLSVERHFEWGRRRFCPKGHPVDAFQ